MKMKLMFGSALLIVMASMTSLSAVGIAAWPEQPAKTIDGKNLKVFKANEHKDHGELHEWNAKEKKRLKKLATKMIKNITKRRTVVQNFIDNYLEQETNILTRAVRGAQLQGFLDDLVTPLANAEILLETAKK